MCVCAVVCVRSCAVVWVVRGACCAHLVAARAGGTAVGLEEAAGAEALPAVAAHEAVGVVGPAQGLHHGTLNGALAGRAGALRGGRRRSPHRHAAAAGRAHAWHSSAGGRRSMVLVLVLVVLMLVLVLGRRSGHRARVDLQRVEQRVQVLRLSAAGRSREASGTRGTTTRLPASNATQRNATQRVSPCVRVRCAVCRVRWCVCGGACAVCGVRVRVRAAYRVREAGRAWWWCRR